MFIALEGNKHGGFYLSKHGGFSSNLGIMSKYNDDFNPETFYHIFDRAVGDEDLFRNQENYNFFLKKVEKYWEPYFSIYAYCLLPNHFHFVVCTNSIKETNNYLEQLEMKKEITADNFHKEALQASANILNAYVKSYNKYYKRKGGLFIRGIKRIQLKKIEDITSAIFYVHKNPIHHGLVHELSDWDLSSCSSIKSSRQDDMIDRTKTLELFGGEAGFDEIHSHYKYKS